MGWGEKHPLVHGHPTPRLYRRKLFKTLFKFPLFRKPRQPWVSADGVCGVAEN
jgi:hypothetical protein